MANSRDSLLTERVQVSVRFDEALRQRLEDAAKASLRSMNAEIIFRLKTSFERQPDEVVA
jgi:hypothetical protein